MALIITQDCINCGACLPECPNSAIYMSGEMWFFDHQPDKKFNSISNDYFYITGDKCTECVGFHEEQQCAKVCPVDCCIIDVNRIESKEELLEKKMKLHEEK